MGGGGLGSTPRALSMVAVTLVSAGIILLACEAFLGDIGMEESRDSFSEFPYNLFLEEKNSELVEEPVYVYVSPDFDTTVLDSYLEVVERDEKNHVVVGRAKPDSLEVFSSLREVWLVRKALPPLVREVGEVPEGAFPSEKLLNSFKVSGAGVKIGIISDGVSLLPEVQASKGLPPDVRVLDAGSGDEGTAMLEIVHGIAPEAELYFHKAGSNHLEFNEAVDALVSAGCTVICDDIGWPDEPFFEDGIVASHVREVIENNDILYVSAAGNDANHHYQGLFFDEGNNWHDFSEGNSLSKNLYVDIPPGGSVIIVLQWNDPWVSSGNDYDLYLKDSAGNILACSKNFQDGDDTPLEYLIYENTGSGSTPDPMHVEGLVSVKKYSGDPKVLELFLYPEASARVKPVNLVAEDSVFGHPAVPGVICVGAIDSGNPDREIETFSSRGPVSIYFPEYELRKKTDISGPNNLKVTGKDGECFILSGTSASAPYVAGIAALVWSAYPEKTAPEIREMLYSTALDPGEPGYDYTYGHGSVNALEMYLSGAKQVEDVGAEKEIIPTLFNLLYLPVFWEERVGAVDGTSCASGARIRDPCMALENVTKIWRGCD